MFRPLLKAALLGGLVVFFWSFISWMVLPWHNQSFTAFTNEDAVANVIQQNAPVQGMYIIPYTLDQGETTSPEAIQHSLSRFDTGPFVFASVVPHGMGHMGTRQLLISFLIQFVGAGILAWLLRQIGSSSLWKRMGVGTVFGLAIGIVGLLPSWNWFGFTPSYLLPIGLDLLVGWTLAGLAMSRMKL